MTVSLTDAASRAHRPTNASARSSSSPSRDFTRKMTDAARSGSPASRAALAKPCATARVHASLAALTAA